MSVCESTGAPLYRFFFPLKVFFYLLLCTHDLSRVNLATELSTNLVYNSIFVIDYNYIYFFFYICLVFIYKKVVYI